MEHKQFQFNNKVIIPSVLLLILGILAVIGALVTDIPRERIIANLHLNNVYFLAFALCGLFFVAVHSIAESGWHTSIQRIPEAMGMFVPFAGIIMLVLFIFGKHDLFHWTHTDHLDEVLLHKQPYLNSTFFYIRFVVYFLGWGLLGYALRKNSLLLGETGDIKYFNKQRTFSAIFVVFFAITSSTASWDWLMSIDAHWFSTLYGWYIFSSLLVSGMAVITLFVLLLRRMGYLPHVNIEHLNDLGRYMFAFSIFWMYLWFSQYMLYWYGNIPEETVYYYERLNNFENYFFINIILCFAAPFLIIMLRQMKRIPFVLGITSVIIIVGHWVDFYQLIMPGSIGDKAGFGMLEIGLTLGYFGLFALFVFRALSKAPLVPKNHPFYKESLEYHTNY
ncbi:MAG: quinol:cytochrome C oxidoreductase [Bacteroidetes bacterium]|jgi:hypothetical protein|nr:quinol:cytochrome C oxidoreductase [Bacteroidota bacterium]